MAFFVTLDSDSFADAVVEEIIFRTKNYIVTGDHHLLGTIRRASDGSEVVTLQGEEWNDLYDKIDAAPENVQDMLLDQYD